jgi:hypothetical protein
MKTTRLPKPPLKKLNLKGPKVSRRKIGSKPNPCLLRALEKKAMREILDEEDKLWLDLARKAKIVGVSSKVAMSAAPLFSTSAIAMRETKLQYKVFP